MNIRVILCLSVENVGWKVVLDNLESGQNQTRCIQDGARYSTLGQHGEMRGATRQGGDKKPMGLTWRGSACFQETWTS